MYLEEIDAMYDEARYDPIFNPGPPDSMEFAEEVSDEALEVNLEIYSVFLSHWGFLHLVRLKCLYLWDI